jgi:hypothetical protein
MYPRGTVAEVMRRKAALRAQIARRRDACSKAAAEVVAPLQVIDRAWLIWRRLPPLARAAIGLAAGELWRRVARTKPAHGTWWHSAVALGRRVARGLFGVSG